MITKWKKLFIGALLGFALYNTLPSVFYYIKPLEAPLSSKQAQLIVKTWGKTQAQHEKQLYKWIQSYARGLGIERVKLAPFQDSLQTLDLEFNTADEQQLFKKHFKEAMAHIPYKTFELNLAQEEGLHLYLVKKYPLCIKGLEQSTYLAPISEDRGSYLSYAQARIKTVEDALNGYDFIEHALKKQSPLASNLKDVELIFNSLDHEPLKTRLVAHAHKLGSPWLKEALKQTSTSTTFQNWLQTALSKHEESPFFKSIHYDLDANLITLIPHSDLVTSPTCHTLLEPCCHYLNLATGDQFELDQQIYKASLIVHPDSPLLLTNLTALAHEKQSDLKKTLSALFKPESLELKDSVFVTGQEFNNLCAVDQESCLIIHAPLIEEPMIKQGSKNSLFIIAKNLDPLSKDSLKFQTLLKLFGFYAIQDSTHPDALIFELKEAYKQQFALVHETPQLQAQLPYAVIELGTLKDRLKLKEALEIQQQEALVSWQDQYAAALNHLKGYSPFTIAQPTKSPLVSNFLLKWTQFFSGSPRQALKFGLDLSGGKNILIALENQQGQTITDPDSIKTAINELYERVNGLGVSEVSIRQQGHLISLDFPGSQTLSAKELVNASTMYFHVVNEKFSFQNPELFPYVNHFLNAVWQQALAQGSLEQKTLQQLGYTLLNESTAPLLSATKLKEHGLKLAHPSLDHPTHALDPTLCKIVKYKPNSQQPQDSCPLILVFHNYALEGTALKEILCSYDGTKGNTLNFKVTKTDPKDPLYSPQATLAEWTSHFTKTSTLDFKPPKGWRMAVTLNSEVVSAPVLESQLKEGGSITGSFTQRDLLKLKGDLEAGALSFQPKIILEQTIAPELGAHDRHKGFLSMAISVVLVTVLMTCYYRFHGLIATGALMINLMLLIASAAFFNITLSLASIAGMILTLGMAVDANVLIFERMKEEKAQGASLAEAVKKGYAKAFSAIVDSNLTTMIAALVLLGFDSGPIKGFALTLLIGLVTSMVTALFMTKFFYFSWACKTHKSSFNFAQWFKVPKLDFLKKTKLATITTGLLLTLGVICFNTKASELIGMDFKGGYGLNLKFEKTHSTTAPKDLVTKALIHSGLKASHIHTRQLTGPHHVQLFLDTAIDKIKNDEDSWSDFFTHLLTPLGLKLDPSVVLDQTLTTISSQLSESMTHQALVGLMLALGCIFVYVLIRFQWPYALAATISLIHDVILTLSFMAILAYLGVPVNFDMSTLAAILTIIGYSLNDTIIVFDRIREERVLHPHLPLKTLITQSLNATLSRTLLTSGTTLIVLIPMLFMGEGTLFNFSLIMTLGVLFGTLSTLYIASPLLLLFYREHNRVKLN
jgi:SecD/SecF fusion protein